MCIGSKMKRANQRVIAIDYFRGLCILVVLINHSDAFSMPFAYFTGDGSLWTSAAEMFLLLSGLTYAIVRGPQILSEFGTVLKKTWRRALIIYSVKTLIVFISLIIALILMSYGLKNDVSGSLPETGGLHLIWSVLNSSYTIGWVSFLMYYAVFLTAAPFIMYLLSTKYWLAVPITSVGLFVLTCYQTTLNTYSSFGYWQIYFVLGLIIGRFRYPLGRLVSRLQVPSMRPIRSGIILLTLTSLTLSALLAFPLSPVIANLANAGWLPVKMQAAYIDLLNHKPTLDYLLLNYRTGVLRPLVALTVFISALLIYDKYRDRILSRTGNFMITMGRNTMAVFVAQALVIPILVSFNLPKNFFTNLMLTSFLVLCMWQLAKAETSRRGIRAYFIEIRNSFYQAKYGYLSKQKES
jgi:hypothetical protein